MNLSKTLAVLGVLVALGAAAPPSAAAEEWPQFRGPTGDGVSSATGVPVEWGATKNVAWKTRVPGSGWSSPVLSGGRIYLTTAVDAGDGATSLRALCVDAAGGQILWDVEVFRPDAAALRSIHKKNSPASATPIVTATASSRISATSAPPPSASTARSCGSRRRCGSHRSTATAGRRALVGTR